MGQGPPDRSSPVAKKALSSVHAAICSRMATTGPRRQAPARIRGTDEMKLIIEDDEGRKTVVPLVRDEITIGRQEGNTIRLTRAERLAPPTRAW